MSATEAIVQFIGIIMMTAGVPNDPGVHAIVPRIERLDPLAPVVDRRTPLHRRGVQILPIRPQGVETHTAVILYEKAARIDISNWTPVDFRETWEYVVLTGERLHFVTSAVNAAPAVPRDLPRACPTTTTLQTAFQAPQYAGAAAVVDIDEGFLDVCVARVKDQVTGRADTRLFLKTDGSLVIVGTKGSDPAKTITFFPDAQIYIANIPPRHLDVAGSLLAAGGPPHHTVYDTMTGTSNCTPVPDTGNICRICGGSPMQTGKQAEPLPILAMIDSECSNSQWP